MNFQGALEQAQSPIEISVFRFNPGREAEQIENLRAILAETALRRGQPLFENRRFFGAQLGFGPILRDHGFTGRDHSWGKQRTNPGKGRGGPLESFGGLAELPEIHPAGERDVARHQR